MRLSLLDFETHLNHFCDTLEPSRVKDALTYSLKGQGKRFRPSLMASLCEELNPDFFNVALALEMIHTYSLIHDDLPAMDNDDLRRGKPTCHIQFNEGLALLAGDALLTEAFGLLSRTTCLDHQKVLLIQWFAKAAGSMGMIKGQDLDLLNDAKGNLLDTELETLYKLKTGALFGCALVSACILNQDENDLQTYYQFGLELGFLFQVQDDVLEATVDVNTLGKSTTSDVLNQKKTYVARYGLAHATETLARGFEQLKRAIINLQPQATDLLELITQIENRKY